ncbi:MULTISPECIES: hypothetical protein [unclassified Rickettsia]|uniref:hypothetical protein n=1 Tax=unclassified Rickettsia TaxID=114295 RepID=UPI003132C0BC
MARFFSRHCEEMRSIDAAIQEKIAKNALKTIVFSRLPRRYAPRNDDFYNDFEPCNNAATTTA